MGKGRIDVWKTIQIRLSQLHHIQLLITFKFVIFCWFLKNVSKKNNLHHPICVGFYGNDLFFHPMAYMFSRHFWEKWLRGPPFFTLGSSISKAIPVVREFGGWIGRAASASTDHSDIGVLRKISWGKSLRNLGDFCTPKNMGSRNLVLFTKKNEKKKNTKKGGFHKDLQLIDDLATCGD